MADPSDPGAPGGAWVYAVVPAQETDLPEDLSGVTGEPVRLLPHHDLAAVVGSIPPELADADQLRQQLRDPDWLEQAVRAHHEVVSALLPLAPTVPFRLATVYRGDARVRELLDQRGPDLRAALATVTGRAEWGVQAYAEPSAVAAATPAAPSPGGDPTHRPGTAYLLQRRAERDRQERARAAAQTAAQQVDTVLAGLAVAVHRAAPASQPSGGTPPPVLSASYLVEDASRDEFTSRVHELAEQYPQLRLRLTGPWPAYSFVEVSQAGEA